MKNTLIAVAVVLVVVAAALFYLFRPAPAPPSQPMKAVSFNVNRQPPPELLEACRGNMAKKVRLVRRDQTRWTKAVDELLSLPGNFTITGGERSRTLLPLASVLEGQEGVKEVALVPCGGDEVQITLSDLRKNPKRYLLMSNDQGSIKVVQYKGGEITAHPRLKYLYSIKLLP